MTQCLRRVFLVCAFICLATSSGRAIQPQTWQSQTWVSQASLSLDPAALQRPGRVVGIPAELDIAKGRAAAAGLPTFTRVISARGKSYKFTMVGRDIFASRAKNVTIPVKIIPVRFVFPDGNTFDPNEPTPSCDGGGVPLDLILQSPLFANYDYGDGPRQFYEFVRRIEFWPFTGGGRVNPRYSVRIAPSVLPTLQIMLPTGYVTVAAHCGRIGAIDMPSLKAFLSTQIFPQFSRMGITPSTFALLLFHNVVVTDGDSIDLGFHSAFSTPKGVQTFGVAEYDSSHEDPTIRDISVLSHEIAEWYDDPFVNNFAPPWGHIGQVSDCYPLLEVGDPLSGAPLFEIKMPNGIAYHPQETAYFSWFFAQPQSYGANGFYSSGGTFTSFAEPCN
jgi:hypothetical protein